MTPNDETALVERAMGQAALFAHEQRDDEKPAGWNEACDHIANAFVRENDAPKLVPFAALSSLARREEGAGSALVKAASITSKVWVENRVERGNGTEMWSEVRTNRPHNSQVAHCADQEDADAIAYLINEALATRPPVAEDDATVADLVAEAQFLCDRLDNLDFSMDMEEFANMHSAHVDPSHSRLKGILSTLRPEIGAGTRDEEAALEPPAVS